MKTVIFSGPNGSGKTSKARLLQSDISQEKDNHYEILSSLRPNLREIALSVKKGNYKTVLLDASSSANIDQIALNLLRNGFKGTFIATTQDKEVNVAKLIGTHDVCIRYLYREPNGTLCDQIMDAIRPVALEHKAILHEMKRPRHAPEYRYIFPCGAKIYIKEGGAL